MVGDREGRVSGGINYREKRGREGSEERELVFVVRCRGIFGRSKTLGERELQQCMRMSLAKALSSSGYGT